MDFDGNIDNLVNKIASELNVSNSDINLKTVEELAKTADENNNDKLEQLSNSFSQSKQDNNENENKDDKALTEKEKAELNFYKSVSVRPVDSSNIEGLSYLEESKILKIRFYGGGEYVYKNVEKLQYTNLMNAKSVGKYFNDNIKAFPDKYAYIKL